MKGSRLLIGLGFLGGGGILIWGGLTGRLAPMVAALFAPSYLTGSDGTTTGTGISDIPPPVGGTLVTNSGVNVGTVHGTTVITSPSRGAA